jgi:hypothetical protein
VIYTGPVLTCTNYREAAAAEIARAQEQIARLESAVRERDRTITDMQQQHQYQMQQQQRAAASALATAQQQSAVQFVPIPSSSVATPAPAQLKSALKAPVATSIAAAAAAGSALAATAPAAVAAAAAAPAVSVNAASLAPSALPRFAQPTISSQASLRAMTERSTNVPPATDRDENAAPTGEVRFASKPVMLEEGPRTRPVTAPAPPAGPTSMFSSSGSAAVLAAMISPNEGRRMTRSVTATTPVTAKSREQLLSDYLMVC